MKLSRLQRRAAFRSGFGSGLGIVFGALTLSTFAHADSEANATTAQTEVASVERDAPAVQAVVARTNAQRLSLDDRLANGQLLYLGKDYSRAIVVLSEVLEEASPQSATYPDALWLRAETYYATKEYLAARRDYRALVEHSSEPRFSPYFGRSLARLVDVSLRTGDVSGLDEVFTRINQVPPAQVDAALVYAKGKAYFAKKDYGTAQQAFAQVPNGAIYTHQARYFQGLLAIKTTPAGVPASVDGKTPAQPANYKTAIEAFRVVTELPPDTAEHRHVIDLGWMAIARLFYEMEQYAQASEAYARIQPDSPEFSTMLFELAWVYVRIGDSLRAERALEVLAVRDPSSPLLGEGSLLRADLLLRDGAFEKALQLYLGVKGQYDPMRAKVEAFLDSTKDVHVYYEKLSQQQLDMLDQNDQVPPLALQWAREAEDGPLAFALIDDVNQCKTLIRQSYQLIEKLSTVLAASNRARAFPELQAGEAHALGLINRIARARWQVAAGLDAEESRDVSGELASVRSQRRALMGQIKEVPTNSAEISARDEAGLKQWNTVSQEISRQSLQVDRLHAIINGLRRMLKDDGQRGVARDPASVRRFADELDANASDLKQRQADIVELRRQLEIGRAQVGLGDSRYQSDAAARMQFRDLLDREVQLVQAGQAGSGAQKYANRVQPTLSQARTVEDKLIAAFTTLEAQVTVRIGELKTKVEAEQVKVDGYNERLAKLDDEAKELVGHVAQRNFQLVRDRLRNLVLRADTGVTEQAWEVREMELERVHNLQTERAREEQLLDEELREVLDDSGDVKK